MHHFHPSIALVINPVALYNAAIIIIVFSRTISLELLYLSNIDLAIGIFYLPKDELIIYKFTLAQYTTFKFILTLSTFIKLLIYHSIIRVSVLIMNLNLIISFISFPYACNAHFISQIVSFTVFHSFFEKSNKFLAGWLSYYSWTLKFAIYPLALICSASFINA